MSIKDYEQILANIDPRISKSAKLRALYPTIEKNISIGLSYRIIMEDLQKAGLTVNYELLHKALSLNRKQNKTAEPSTNQPENTSPPVTKPTPAPIPEPASVISAEPTERAPIPGVSTTPRRIESPADLRAVRNMQIDLNALREEGLAKRRQKK
jgi:pyruvate/2-oxoglutarate dehydrogenase complex dihydrolipoamide acyltransferase (E2) component